VYVLLGESLQACWHVFKSVDDQQASYTTVMRRDGVPGLCITCMAVHVQASSNVTMMCITTCTIAKKIKAQAAGFYSLELVGALYWALFCFCFCF
jgi:hypothetical protein